jgi:hypothetical protein
LLEEGAEGSRSPLAFLGFSFLSFILGFSQQTYLLRRTLFLAEQKLFNF